MSVSSEEKKRSGLHSSSDHSSGMVVGGNHVAPSTLFLIQKRITLFVILKETNEEVEGHRVGRGKEWRRKKRELWIVLHLILGAPHIWGSLPRILQPLGE